MVFKKHFFISQQMVSGLLYSVMFWRLLSPCIRLYTHYKWSVYPEKNGKMWDIVIMMSPVHTVWPPSKESRNQCWWNSFQLHFFVIRTLILSSAKIPYIWDSGELCRLCGFKLVKPTRPLCCGMVRVSALMLGRLWRGRGRKLRKFRHCAPHLGRLMQYMQKRWCRDADGAEGF